MGPHGSGKTGFRRSLQGKPFKQTKNRGFLQRYDTSVSIDGEKVPLHIWEASEESVACLHKLLIDLFIIVIDGSHTQSVHDIEKNEVRPLNRSFSYFEYSSD